MNKISLSYLGLNIHLIGEFESDSLYEFHRDTDDGDETPVDACLQNYDREHQIIFQRKSQNYLIAWYISDGWSILSSKELGIV